MLHVELCGHGLYGIIIVGALTIIMINCGIYDGIFNQWYFIIMGANAPYFALFGGMVLFIIMGANAPYLINGILYGS